MRDPLVTTNSTNRATPRAYTETTNRNDFFGVDTMNTELVTETFAVAPTPRERTLKTLLQVICAEDEFAVLRETLRIYCEEMTKE